MYIQKVATSDGLERVNHIEFAENKRTLEKTCLRCFCNLDACVTVPEPWACAWTLEAGGLQLLRQLRAEDVHTGNESLEAF